MTYPTQALDKPRIGGFPGPVVPARARSGGDFTLPSFLDASTLVLQELAELRQQVAELHARVSDVRRWSGAIASLDDSRFELRLPLPVGFEEKEGTVVAHSPDFETYGSGESEYEALDDLRKAIVEDYVALLEEGGELGPLPSRLLTRMASLIRRV